MCAGGDLSLKLQLRPLELTGCPDIPYPLLVGQIRFQDDHILRPANGHGHSHNLRIVFIGTVELPHPAQVPGREAGNVRVRIMQVFRCGSSGAFLRSAADYPANLAAQFHLRQNI